MVTMELLPVATGQLTAGDDIVEHIYRNIQIEEKDIIVVSGKVIATVENTLIDLDSIEVSDAAAAWAAEHDRDPGFRQAVLHELKRLNGDILDEESRYMRAEVRPKGLETGTILTAAAGLDESNAPKNQAIGWPQDPVASAVDLRDEIYCATQKHVGIIVSDSCLLPRRQGVVAQALVAVGLDPIESRVDDLDLFGKPLRVTKEAHADQLATAANFLMGSADEAIPVVVVRGHGLPFTDFAGWVPGIEPKEDLFQFHSMSA